MELIWVPNVCWTGTLWLVWPIFCAMREAVGCPKYVGLGSLIRRYSRFQFCSAS
jgi:hypothetical protein